MEFLHNNKASLAGWLLFYAVRRALPRARRRANTLRPLDVDILLRKPCTTLRARFLG